MTTPGSNMLARAARVIRQSPFQYIRFLGRTNNAAGLLVASYSKPCNTSGSVQPVPRSLLEKYGLDLQSAYLMVYIQASVIDVERDASGDQIVFEGHYYNLLSDTRWFPIDGWTGFICVKVTPPGTPNA